MLLLYVKTKGRLLLSFNKKLCLVALVKIHDHSRTSTAPFCFPSSDVSGKVWPRHISTKLQEFTMKCCSPLTSLCSWDSKVMQEYKYAICTHRVCVYIHVQVTVYFCYSFVHYSTHCSMLLFIVGILPPINPWTAVVAYLRRAWVAKCGCRSYAKSSQIPLTSRR